MPGYFHSFAMHVPARLITNHDLATLMDTSHEWIVQRSGIETRYWVEPPTTTSDLAVEAARKSFEYSGELPDAIIAATLSPDYCFPGIGVLIQHKLRLPSVPAFDIRNQCSGFLYSADMAEALVQSGRYQRILIACAEVHSTGLDISTRGRDVAVLFGDGAGTCLVSNTPTRGINLEFIDSDLRSDGAYVQDLWCEHPGSAHFPTRVTPDLVTEGKVFPVMNGRKVFEHAVQGMTEVSQCLLKKHSLSGSDVALFVPHQANLRINAAVSERLGLTPRQLWNTIQKYGNTTAATIPIGIATAIEAGRLTHGDVVLSAAFGSGFTWGAMLFRVVQQQS